MPESVGVVLVIDDDQSLTFILRAHLANAGFEVHVAHDGKQGFDEAVRLRPNVILLDVQMPHMDGLEVLRAMRIDPDMKNIPVILLTARSSRNDVVLGLEAGAQEYVTKPFDMAELTARVRSMMRLSHMQLQFDELNARLAGEVQQKTQRLELLYSYVRELSRAPDEERIYDLFVETVQRATGCRRVSVMVHDPVLDKLVCRKAVGIDPVLAEKLMVDPGAGIAGQVFSTGTTVVAKAVDSPGSRRRSYNSDDFLSTPLVSTYLMNGQERLGVLNVTDKADGKPFLPEEIECICSIADSAAIALHNERRRSARIKSIRALLLTVGRLSEYRDEETGLHLERVREYAQILARQLSQRPALRHVVTPDFVTNLYDAAPLHDLGKVGIPDDILNKPGKLTDEEFQIMKTHTTIGRHTLALAMEETGPVPLLQMCIDIAYCHHERYDGRGYPRGLKGEDIPLTARIITLVDAYDAMTSQRCYKRALPHERAVELICADSGAHFDPQVVEAFLEVADDFDRVRASKSDPITEPAISSSRRRG